MSAVPHWITWEELCADPSLQDLPYRIELNGLNQIVMSPRHYRHGRYASKIVNLLTRLLPTGETSIETAVLTPDNIKVPDVVWATHAFARQHADASALPVAPDLCVEVLSPTNRALEIDQKRALYFEAGAREVWICGLEHLIKVVAALYCSHGTPLPCLVSHGNGVPWLQQNLKCSKGRDGVLHARRANGTFAHVPGVPGAGGTLRSTRQTL